MNTRAIILAGGEGTRMNPVTKVLTKHLFPVYNKPMIFYPLSILIYLGIKEILIICKKDQRQNLEKVLMHVIKKNNLKIFFNIQKNSKGGIAEAIIIGKNFIKNSKKILIILGDNFFYGREFIKILKNTLRSASKTGHLFLSPVNNPEDYGIAYINNKGVITKIIEKPKKSKSNLAITGLYIYFSNILKYINKISRSKRGELEISSLNQILLKEKNLSFTHLGRGITWFDMGTYDNLYECSTFIKFMENKQGLKIADI